jgi:hypothetical protein
LHLDLLRLIARHQPAADGAVAATPGIGRIVGLQMILQQPPGQSIAQVAGAVLALGKGNQPILAIAAQHLIKRPPGLLLKFLTHFEKFFALDSRHDRSSLIGCEIHKTAILAAIPIIYPARGFATTVMDPLSLVVLRSFGNIPSSKVR